jgi:hypothetical protein
MAAKRELPLSCVIQLACEELAGGLDAFGRQDMTEARIEFRLDLETSSSQPFRRKPSLLRWNDGIILTVRQQDLDEVFSFRLGRSRERRTRCGRASRRIRASRPRWKPPDQTPHVRAGPAPND